MISRMSRRYKIESGRAFCELSKYANSRFKDSVSRRASDIQKIKELQSKMKGSWSASRTRDYFKVSL